MIYNAIIKQTFPFYRFIRSSSVLQNIREFGLNISVLTTERVKN